jgi:uncharacterized BrkB/YihY/UPF0761 family membrane protein
MELIGIILGIALIIGGFLSFSAIGAVNTITELEDLSIQYLLIEIGFILIACGIIILAIFTRNERPKKKKRRF